MGAKKIKAATTITQHEEQELSLDAIEIRPDLLQTRAGISWEHVKAYAESIANGQSLPPVVVFRDDSGRLMLADGFHRVEAHKRLGLRSIRAVIRDGTYQDALLYGIQANLATISHQPPNEADRKHAAAMMIRNGAGKPGEGTWDWADNRIRSHCLSSTDTIARVRLGLLRSEGIPLPVRVAYHSVQKGISVIRTLPYKPKAGDRPSATRCKNGKFYAWVGGKTAYVGSSPEAAEAKLSEIEASRKLMAKHLATSEQFRQWLESRAVSSRMIAPLGTILGGIVIDDALLLSLDHADQDRILREVGRSVYLRAQFPWIQRVILVGMFGRDRNAGRLIGIAKEHGLPVEFMAPEEVVAEFGPKGAGADA
jgi:hypothetical protein